MSYPTLSTPGSSAVGLTASINKDPVTKDNFALKILKKNTSLFFFGGKHTQIRFRWLFFLGGLCLEQKPESLAPSPTLIVFIMESDLT